MTKKLRVAVLFGGQSSEHEVSRVSAQSVLENLDPEKYDITAIGITKKGQWLSYIGDYQHIGTGAWESMAMSSHHPEPWLISSSRYTDCGTIEKFLLYLSRNEKIDVIFPVLHGNNGEDGAIQGLLELAEIPYVGCNILSSAVGMDKAVSKILFEHEGIPQAKYLVIKRPDIFKDLEGIQAQVDNKIGYPCFVKPANAGSSVGISKVKTADELLPALEKAGRYDRKILIEQFIDGREVECAVLGFDSPIASTVGEIVPCNEFYDYQAKYVDGDSQIIIPAQLDEAATELVRANAIAAFKALDCNGLSRVDFFVEKNTGVVYINEINTMPGFTSISMYPKLWMDAGIPYNELLDRLIDIAILRFHENQRSYEREI